MRTSCLSCGFSLAGIAALSLFGVPAFAQPSNASGAAVPRGGDKVAQFELSRQNDPEILTYQGPHNVRVCNRTDQHPIDLTPSVFPWLVRTEPTGSAESRPTVLDVRSDGRTERLYPGQCALSTARTVEIGTAAALSATTALPGSMRSVPVSALTSEELAYNGLIDQLRQVDETTRRDTATFNRARRELLRAAHELASTQRVETRVWLDETAAAQDEAVNLLPRGSGASVG